MVGVLVAALADGYWTCKVRDQTVRVYLHPLMYKVPWRVPAAADRVLLAPTANGGWTVLGILGRGVPVAT